MIFWNHALLAYSNTALAVMNIVHSKLLHITIAIAAAMKGHVTLKKNSKGNTRKI